jgi:ABC-type transport system involved in multi-copper enzyme maturation permease subunit
MGGGLTKDTAGAFPGAVDDAIALASGWPLWRRQARAVVTGELAKGLSAWRGLWLLALAFAPTFIITTHAVHGGDCVLGEKGLIMAGIMQFYYARFALVFGSLGVFVRLVRGEMAEHTLHYAFLAPVRREVLLLGKFLAGAITMVAVFTLGVLASFLMMYAHFEDGRAFLLQGGGLAHLRAYLLVTVLACLGYGAVFLALSLLFKNPIVPAVGIVLWEGVNGALPVWLKRLSVTHYLKPLFPVDLPIEGFLGLFTVVAEPTPAWVAVTGLLGFTALAVLFAAWRIRRIELSYGTD